MFSLYEIDNKKYFFVQHPPNVKVANARSI